MNKAWPIIKLGEVLTPVVRRETVDASKDYRLLGVRLDGNGPFLRETVSGAETAAKTLFSVATGDFIYSRLFACRGAFGVVNASLDGCYVSGEFPTFAPIPDRVCVQFLSYWFRLPSVISSVNEQCSGSTPLTRNRFKEQFFLNLEIPLPDLFEQRRIMERIEKLTTEITSSRQLRAEQEIELQQMLGGAFWRISRDAPKHRMRDVAPLVRRAVDVDVSAIYPELGIRCFGNGTFHKPALTGFELGGKRIFHIEPGDLLFSNVFAWEGAIAVARPEDKGRFGSHRFITCVPIENVATAPFLCFYFLTNEGLELIRAASPGGAGRNRTLGIEALADIQVPVPKFQDQCWFDSLQSQVAELKLACNNSAVELDALLPSILNRAFKGELV